MTDGLRGPVFALLVSVLAASEVLAEPATLRPYPYPFSHVVTFASDVDMQEPWHGHSIHGVLNEELGLPISDSMWVQGVTLTTSGLFAGGRSLRREDSGIENHPTFGLLVREWHRGNIDHLHSWQSDATVALLEAFDPPIPLSGASVEVALKEVPTEGFPYGNLRLYFDGEVPEGSFVHATDRDGGSRTFSVAEFAAGQRVQLENDGEYVVELMDDGHDGEETRESAGGLNLAKLTRLLLHVPGCAEGCEIGLQRVERDNFSRNTVERQLPALLSWNIRPPILTSHGGNTLAQDFAHVGFERVIPRTPGTLWESPLVNNRAVPMADARNSHAFHADLLQTLGVEHVTGFKSEGRMNGQFWNAPNLALTTLYAGFYEFDKTKHMAFADGSLDEFVSYVESNEPLLTAVDLQEIYCGNICTSDQGAMLGLLVATSLARIENDHPTEHLWYTHFGTGDLDWERTREAPLKESAVEWLQKLANHYYDFDGTVPARHRVWVPPAGVMARYRAVKSLAEAHIEVDEENSQVSVRGWRDPVTGRQVPAAHTGTRDLHGLTVYVPSSSAATLEIEGERTEHFVRNGPDETGRESITIVDNNTPTVILDEVAWSALGDVVETHGRYEDAGAPREGPAYGESYGTWVATSAGDSEVELRPGALDLWNTTHLHLAYRKSNREGQFFVELELEDGRVIGVAEGQGDAPPADSDSGWWLTPAEGGSEQWQYVTLDTAQLLWNTASGTTGESSSRPALPLGRVIAVRVGLRGAPAGARVDVDGLTALRPSANGEAPDGGKLVAGRVTLDGREPVGGQVVEAVDERGEVVTALTDRHGYYFFPQRRRGARLEVSVMREGERCHPAYGRLIDVRKNEAELDIDLSECSLHRP